MNRRLGRSPYSDMKGGVPTSSRNGTSSDAASHSAKPARTAPRALQDAGSSSQSAAGMPSHMLITATSTRSPERKTCPQPCAALTASACQIARPRRESESTTSPVRNVWKKGASPPRRSGKSE